MLVNKTYLQYRTPFVKNIISGYKTNPVVFIKSISVASGNLLRQQAFDNSVSYITAIKKNGKRVACEITSAVFLDERATKKVTTTIADMSPGILLFKI